MSSAMLTNRISRFALTSENGGQATNQVAFAACPGCGSGGPALSLQDVYRVAFEQARREVAAKRRLTVLRNRPYLWN